MTQCPDPNNPGVPLNPEVSGWHWLQENDSRAEIIPFEWQKGYDQWWLGSDGEWQGTQYVSLNYHYLGPCPKPEGISND